MDIIVKKVLVEYNVSNGVASDSYVKDAEIFAKEVLIPMIERILLQKYGSEYNAHFSRLEFNIDSKQLASFGELANISETELYAEIEKQVDEKIDIANDSIHDLLSPWQHLFFILLNGYKHWTYSYADQLTFESELKESFLSVLNDPGLRIELSKAFESSTTQLGLEGTLSKAFMKEIINDIISYYFQGDSKVYRNVKERILEFTSEGKKYNPDLIQFYSKLLIKSQKEVATVISDNLKLIEDSLATRKGLVPLFIRLFHNSKSRVESIRANKRHDVNSNFDTKFGFSNDESADMSIISKQTWHVPPLPRQNTSGANELFIDNLGLILIAPFLPTLFGRLGLVKNDVLTNASMAVCVVQHISGFDDSYEQDMIMAKILCGVDLNQGIEQKPLSKKAKNEVQKLLESVIQNWTIIGNSSIPSLQSTFLRRSGKFTFQSESRIALLIEKRTEDILLNYVPWTFRTVQLPWARVLINTEWG